MVRMRVAINYAMGAILLLIFVTSLRMSFNDVNRYGWYYNRTITIGADVVVEEVSITANLFGEAFLLVTGIMLIISGSELSSYSGKYTRSQSNDAGIEFLGDPPKHWDIWYDVRSHTVGVTLDGKGVSFPLTMIEKWIEETLSEEDIAAIKGEATT